MDDIYTTLNVNTYCYVDWFRIVCIFPLLIIFCFPAHLATIRKY